MMVRGDGEKRSAGFCGKRSEVRGFVRGFVGPVNKSSCCSYSLASSVLLLSHA
jgi:hypothetical protein